MSSQTFAAAASLALLGAGLVSAEGTRSAMALPSMQMIEAADAVGSAAKCRVEVVRSGTPGTADITRLLEADGSCVCTVTTGPSTGNAQAEELVGSLLRNRSCDGAPPPNQNPTAFAPGANPLPLIAAPVGAGGAAAAAAGGSDSPG